MKDSISTLWLGPRMTFFTSSSAWERWEDKASADGVPVSVGGHYHQSVTALQHVRKELMD